MSKRTHTVDSKTLAAIEKQASKARAINEKIAALKEQLRQMETDTSWLNYLGTDSTSTLTQDEQYRLREAYSNICYHE